MNILYWRFSFWLTSLCIIGSSFIHLIRTDSTIPVFLPGDVYGQRSLMGYNPWCCKELDTTGWLRAFQIERIRCKGHCHFSWAIERGWREERRSGTKAGWSWRLEWRVSSIWRVMKSHMKSLFILKSLFNTYEWGLFSAQWNFAVALACIVLKILLNLHCSLARPSTMSSLRSQSQHIPCGPSSALFTAAFAS